MTSRTLKRMLEYEATRAKGFWTPGEKRSSRLAGVRTGD